jgi:hypothetical protein
MALELTSYAIIRAFGAFIASLVAGIAWRRKETPGGKSLTAMMLAAVIWAGGAALEHASIGLAGQIFWSKVEYFGTVSCPVFLLLFALEYNHLNQYLTQRSLAFLFTIPLITLGLAWTNEWHGLIWSGFTPSPAGENLTIISHAPGFWIGAVGYSYILMLVGTVLLIRGVLELPSMYRRQVTLIMTAAIIP